MRNSVLYFALKNKKTLLGKWGNLSTRYFNLLSQK